MGTNVVVGSSSWVRSMMFGVVGASVFARFGDGESRSMTSASRLFVVRGGPRATLFVPVVGRCAEDWP